MTDNIIDMDTRLRDGRAIKTEEDEQRWLYEIFDRISNDLGQDRTPVEAFPPLVRVMVEWADVLLGFEGADLDLRMAQTLGGCRARADGLTAEVPRAGRARTYPTTAAKTAGPRRPPASPRRPTRPRMPEGDLASLATLPKEREAKNPDSMPRMPRMPTFSLAPLLASFEAPQKPNRRPAEPFLRAPGTPPARPRRL
jgi:hypothetical protein